MLEFMAQNADRVPDWPWLRAQDIVRGGPAATPRRDGPTSAVQIGRAARFCKALQNCDSDERLLMKLAEQMPDLFWAHYLYNQPEHPMRWSLEARILAGETNVEIATRIGCGEVIVQMYEALFFNVRDKLNRTDYIFIDVLKDAFTRNINEREKDMLWKLVAYTGGSQALDAMINPLVNPEWIASLDDVPAFIKHVAIGLVKKKAAIAALCVPINEKNQTKLIKAYGKILKLERSKDSEGKGTNKITTGIDAMLDSFFRVRSTKAAKSPRRAIVGIRPTTRRVPG